MKITVSNDFHGTACTAHVSETPHGLFITDRQARRVKSTLCGIEGCTCSGDLGDRPVLPKLPVEGGFYLKGEEGEEQ